MYFNSTMVRLKLIKACKKPERKPFQFHYGTIKISKSSHSERIHVCFNSTMVRLKYIPSLLILLPFICFNSTMVRLKLTFAICDVKSANSFNSTMVRLKLYSTMLPQMYQLVSIPLWYD